MGVDLGGGDTGVSQKFLDVSQGGSILKQVGGEAVAQGVGSDAGLDSGGLGIVFQH